jgi:hypothetical protein
MKRGGYWYPPAEYMSQRQQDRYEPSGGLQIRPQTAPQSPEDELQWILWQVGLRVDVQIDHENRDFYLIGKPEDIEKAKFFRWQYIAFKQARQSPIWRDDWK